MAENIIGTSTGETLNNLYDSVSVDAAGGNDVVNNWGNYATIRGGAGSDSIYNNSSGNYSILDAGAGNDRINNWAVDSTLYGGSGNDTIYNDEKAQRSVIDAGDGNDRIESWNEQSTVFTGSGDDTVVNSAASSVISLGGGTNVIRTYNDADFIIFGGDDDQELKFDILNGSSINATINFGTGNDTVYATKNAELFVLEPGDGKNTIFNLGAEDTISINGTLSDYYGVSNENIQIRCDNGAVNIHNGIGKYLTIIDKNGVTHKAFSDYAKSQQSVIKDFMTSLDQTTLSGSDALDEAVKASSHFSSMQDVIDNMISDCKNAADADTFLRDYCGIILDNQDTGAITGWDAGGKTLKTAESIVLEDGSAYTFSGTSFTKKGLTLTLPAASSLTNSQKKIINGLYSWWIEEGLDLVEESYGANYGFTSDASASVNKMNVVFSNEDNNTLALVNYSYWTSGSNAGKASELTLKINMKYYDSMTDSINGASADTSLYLDRTLAHEFTHAVMTANMNYFGKLPAYITEGMAELTHGIDEFRTNDIKTLAGNSSKLKSVFDTYDYASVSDVSNPSYAGGYMLLRYLAKQTAKNSGIIYNGTNGNDSLRISMQKTLIDAQEGNDTIKVSSQYVTIHGGNGNDSIVNSGSNNVYRFGVGDGNDTVIGYTENDTLQFHNGTQWYHNTVGNDVLIKVYDGTILLKDAAGKKLNSTVGYEPEGIYNGNRNTIVNGTSNAEFINNWTQNVTINGDAGNDTITNGWRASLSAINGGAGNDLIFVQSGYETINGGKGNDVIYSNISNSKKGRIHQYGIGDGNDTIYGYTEDDSIQVYAGTSFSTVVSGDDLLLKFYDVSVLLKDAKDKKINWATAYQPEGGIYNGTRNTVVNGTSNAELINSWATSVTVNANAGNDTIYSGWRASLSAINGGAGNDLIFVTSGYETIDGGAGNDTVYSNMSSAFKGRVYQLDPSGGKDVVIGYTANDSVYITDDTSYSTTKSGSDLIVKVGDTAQLTLKDAASTKLNITFGNASDNTIINDKNNVKVTGTTGKDYIINSGDNVTIQAGKGNDTIIGSDLYGETYLFSYASGNDIILNFGANDTLKSTSGSISDVETVGNDVVVTITKSGTSGTVTLQGAASYNFKQTSTAVTVEPGIDFNVIQNDQDGKRIVGTSDIDSITNTGENVTIVGSAGLDTITGSDTFGELYQFTSLNGGNIITNFGTGDTLQVTKGSIYSTVLSGNDLIVELGAASTAGTVTLQGAGAYVDLIKKSGKYLIFDDVQLLINQTDNKKITGKSNQRSYIINTGNNVTLGGGSSLDDTLEGTDSAKEIYLFSGGSGEDRIVNFGKEDTLYISGGSISNRERVGTDYIVNVSNGNTSGTVTLEGAGIYDFKQDGKKLTVKNVNYIFNETDNKKVTGISKEDFITNSGEKVTIQAGKGNDTIIGSNFDDIYLFSYNSNDDVILNFDAGDTLKSTSGTITDVKKVGADHIVTITKSDTKGTITLKDTADYIFKKTSTTLTIDTINVIDNGDDDKKIIGTSGRDSIINAGENVTIQAGAGDDTIDGSETFGETFLFSYASGNDVITNVGENDTLRSTNGTISAVETVNDDLVVSIKKKGQSAVGKITLQGATSLNFEYTSSYLRFIPSVKPIYATDDDQKVTGTTNNDYIINPGFERVSIQAGKGNDTIDGSIFGETFLFSYASDDDLITNFDAKDTVKSTSGTLSYKLNGDDVIVSIKKGSTVGTVTLEGAAIYKADLKKTDSTLYVNSKNIKLNTEDNKKITGTTGVDYISNTGEHVTIQAGAGNDILTGSDEYGDRFLFSYASGDDTITNFGVGDTLQSTSGTLSYKQSGNDYIVSIKKDGQKAVGTITLQDAATNYTLTKSGSNYVARPKSTSAQLPSENDYWFLNDKSVEESPLNEIVSTDAAIELDTDFSTELFNRSTFGTLANPLQTKLRRKQSKQ